MITNCCWIIKLLVVGLLLHSYLATLITKIVIVNGQNLTILLSINEKNTVFEEASVRINFDSDPNAAILAIMGYNETYFTLFLSEFF